MKPHAVHAHIIITLSVKRRYTTMETVDRIFLSCFVVVVAVVVISFCEEKKKLLYSSHCYSVHNRQFQKTEKFLRNASSEWISSFECKARSKCPLFKASHFVELFKKRMKVSQMNEVLGSYWVPFNNSAMKLRLLWHFTKLKKKFSSAIYRIYIWFFHALNSTWIHHYQNSIHNFATCLFTMQLDNSPSKVHRVKKVYQVIWLVWLGYTFGANGSKINTLYSMALRYGTMDLKFIHGEFS